MCGIVGEVQREGGVCLERLERLAGLIEHRGPDQGGVVAGAYGRWGVAHRRLAILDPEGGRQPFHAVAEGLTLVFNGEIYEEERLRAATPWNFRTRSDTEVLLALYAVHGLDFLRHLRGEFAFALIDERKRKLILVRDRLGLKPLYYTRFSGGLLFASEMKALLADARVAREPDPTGVCAALLAVDTPGTTTLRDVHQVPNAHAMIVDLDTLDSTLHRYWDAWTDRRQDLPTAYEDQVRLVRATVDEAIQLRQRADVPLGVFLSGGLDSSLIAARLASRVESLDAFVIVPENLPANDERRYAHALGERYRNLRLHDIRMTNDDLLRALPDAVWHMERPFANLHVAAKVLAARYARKHVGCVMTGDGGDESFCGYPSFLVQDDWQREHGNGRSFPVKWWGDSYLYLDGGGLRQEPECERLETLFGFRPAEMVLAANRLRRLRRLVRRSFGRSLPFDALAAAVAGDLPSGNGDAQVQSLHYLHLRAFGPEYIAALSDRTESAGSLEARPPLFDHKVVELGMGLPTSAKLREGRPKAVLDDAFRDDLVPSIAQRRKQPFILRPMALSSPAARELMERHLNHRAVRDAGILRPETVLTLRLARRLRPHRPFTNRALMTALTIQMWHDQFVRGNAPS